MIVALVAAALLDAQTPTPAVSSATATPASAPMAAPAAPASKSALDEDDKVVCKSEQVTGSRFSHRICHTKSEWAQIEKDSRDELMDQQSQSYRNPSNGH